ncbi:MAG: hypothetical protein QOE36_2743 [Gaiellaceae bacterium]|nr:hypothetical protein [Gaiellaceae bacterium]
MIGIGTRIGWRCGVLALVAASAALALPAAAAARTVDGPGAPVWQTPTPADGVLYSIAVGQPLSISVAAAVLDPAAVVHIDAAPLPDGATFVPTDGNPARGVLTWKPSPDQVGDVTISFSAAVVGAGETATRTVRIHVYPAFDEHLPFPLSDSKGISRSAYVLSSATARSAPSTSARAVARLAPLTGDGVPNLVLLLQGVYDQQEREWVRVRLAILPNNSTGWVPRSSLGEFRQVRTHLVVDRGAFTATLFRSGKRIFRARIGVGRPYWPTPRGEFYVREHLTNFDNPFYGPVAFGTSGRSAVLTDWPGGGFVGIHGTNEPGLLPGRVSHGCVRLRNADILRLERLLPVGTPLTIR